MSTLALLRHFDYDSKAPLDVQEAGVEQRGDVAIHDISYASPKGGRVPAYLVVPKGRDLLLLVTELNLKPPDPAVIARIPELVQPPARKN
jgi:hypothetical protein